MMCALCFVLLRANASEQCAALLSSLQFLGTFSQASAGVKAFVDVCVAVKYLSNLATQLRSRGFIPALPALPGQNTTTTATTTGTAQKPAQTQTQTHAQSDGDG